MNSKTMKYSAVAASLLLTAVMAGCGTSNKEGSSVASDVAKVSEKTCAQCHGSSFNSQSGMPIYSEYVQSAHFQNSVGLVVGCQDCHGGGSQHNGVGPIPFPNPDAEGKCFDCHKDAFLGKFNADQKPTAIQKAHFYNITGAGRHDAMYVTKNFEKNCTACHEPHNPLKGKGAAQRKAWAESGHGKVSNLPFADRDFKATADCIRCHTSTGYVNFLNDGWKVPTTTWATAGDNGREVLTCRTCHNNDSFSVRRTTAFTAPYNGGNSPKTFPNVGESNLCLACHTGRESADTIESVTNFKNVSFKNSHYKVGAGLMYMAIGFDNFTTSSTKIKGTTNNSTYRTTMNPDNVSVPTFGIAGGVTSTHRKLGTPLINGDTHNTSFFVPGTADSNGPCVTCHLNVAGAPDRPATGHSWKIDVNAAQQLCINCHGSEVGTGGVADAAKLEAFLEEQAAGFHDALDLIAKLLQTTYKISYNPDAYPYFYDDNLPLVNGKKQAVKDWTRGTNDQAIGKRIMGVCFNLNALTKDGGAYAHARTYVRRLVYDSIDYLDDKLMNGTTGATALATTPAVFQKGATAYTDGTLTTKAAGTSDAMIYLIGWSRSTGAWNAQERP